MRSPRYRLLGAALAPMILLAACGGGDGEADTDGTTSSGDDAAVTSAAPRGDLADVEVDDSGDNPALTLGGQPFADADLPFVAGQTEVREVTAGEGEEITEEHHVEANYVMVNGTTGEEVLSTFSAEQNVTFDLTNANLLPGLTQTLVGTAPGASMVLALPAADAFGETGDSSLGIGPTDTLVFYLEVVGAHIPLTQAQGTEVDPVEGLPTVQADGTGPAQVTMPEGEDPPGELVVQPLIEGEGEEVTAGQNVMVHYTGVKWSDGEQFDSSLEAGSPFTFQLGQGRVIAGWDEGLAGQTVGSRVLLVVPPEKGYGGAQEGQPGAELSEETLVFVVDILDAD